MADINVASVGTQGPAGPGSVAPGAVISTRGALIVGNASAVPAALPIGASGRYLRSDGSDALWSAILAGDLPAAIDAVKLGGGTLTNAKLAFLATITSDLQAQLNAKAALAHAHADQATRGLYVDHVAQSLSTVDNTASLTTYANAIDYTVVLPTGTWTVRAIGGMLVQHSAAGTVQFRVSVAGADTTARTLSTTSSTLYTQVIDDDSGGGLSGTIHVYVQFRSITAGTTFTKNPWLMIIAERTS